MDRLDMSLSVLVRPLSRRVRDPAQPGKATGDAEDWEPGDGAGTVRALLRVCGCRGGIGITRPVSTGGGLGAPELPKDIGESDDSLFPVDCVDCEFPDRD